MTVSDVQNFDYGGKIKKKSKIAPNGDWCFVVYVGLIQKWNNCLYVL